MHFKDKTRQANRGKNAKFVVDEQEALHIAERIKLLCDQRLDALHSKVPSLLSYPFAHCHFLLPLSVNYPFNYLLPLYFLSLLLLSFEDIY